MYVTMVLELILPNSHFAPSFPHTKLEHYISKLNMTYFADWHIKWCFIYHFLRFLFSFPFQVSSLSFSINAEIEFDLYYLLLKAFSVADNRWSFFVYFVYRNSIHNSPSAKHCTLYTNGHRIHVEKKNNMFLFQVEIGYFIRIK